MKRTTHRVWDRTHMSTKGAWFGRATSETAGRDAGAAGILPAPLLMRLAGILLIPGPFLVGFSPVWMDYSLLLLY
ncbi:hypothetical protein Y032_0011g1251 [Ancylostoma ceylanicum]|uniref:Uncharacterized protein n=1 Tax=Ancylostoma ceylanicum TaxID=53326 RepID=A0A016VFK6_9BILA|nr:hypothetical protein Y032_0011g1251 [Ancylostoma ceylanicum]